MSTDTTYKIESSSSEDTFALGERLGRLCRGGEVITLTSDLGGGKTTFTKGMAVGLGCEENVSSPTFTINRVHKCRDDLSLHHFDLYRLSAAGFMAHELGEVIGDENAVIVVEWGDIVDEVLPRHRLEIAVERSPDNENGRTFIVKCPKELSYLNFKEK